MSCNWSRVLLLLLCITTSSSNGDCTCDDPNSAGDEQVCENFFRLFESALLNNGSNLYKLRKLFLQINPPELVNVTFYLEFNNNGFLDACSCAGDRLTNQTLFNGSGIVALRYGWTTIGVYNLIHPALLNQLQVQLPFSIMRRVVNEGYPFLWNGYNQLSSTNLHLYVSNSNFTCLPYISQVDGVMKSLTSLIKFYATTENRAGDMQKISDTALGLSGQFVSNWDDLSVNSSRNVQFLSDVALVNKALFEVIQGAVIACSFFIGLALFYLLHKLLEQGKISVRNRRKSDLFSLCLGSVISICGLGLLMFLAELISWNSRPIFYEFLIMKHSYIYFVTVVPFVCLEVCYFVFIPNNRNFFFKNTWRIVLLSFIIFLSSLFYFAILWIFASVLDTLVLVIAYPVHVITLVVLHIAFVFVESIIFAVIVSEFNQATTSRRDKERKSLLSKLNLCTIFGCCLVCSIFFGFIYLVIIIGYASIIVQRIVPGDGVVQSLFFLPSLILFMVGWLLKRSFFQTGIPEQNKVIEEISRLHFPIEKRVELGKHLGIPSDDLHSIEMRAIGKIDSKRAVLSEMVYYWFDRNKSASYSNIIDIINTKMQPSMNLDGYDDQVFNGKVHWFSRCVQESDIQEIIATLGQETIKRIDLDMLAKNLDVTMFDSDGGLQQVLQDWINIQKDNATWGVLIRILKKVNREAATKIEKMKIGEI